MQAKSKNTPTLLIVLLLVATIGLVAGGLVVRAYVRSEQARTLLDDNSDATAPVRVALVTGRVVREQAPVPWFSGCVHRADGRCPGTG